MKVLFTGEAGQLATHISRLLQGHRLFEVLSASAWKTNPSKHHPWPELDVTNFAMLDEAINCLRPDAVIHVAAVVNTDKCASDPKNSIDVNLLGTHNILKACDRYGAKLMFFSTTATYDPGTTRPFYEDSKQKPPTLYGITKYAGELLVTGQNKVPWVVIRPCFVYGDPPLDHSSQLCRVAVHQVLKWDNHPETGTTPVVTLDPLSLKDYMRVENFADAILSILLIRPSPFMSRTFNISDQHARPMGEYFSELEAALRIGKLDMKWDPTSDYMGNHVVDSGYLRQVTGWEPRLDWKEGVKRTAESALKYVRDVRDGKIPLLYK